MILGGLGNASRCALALGVKVHALARVGHVSLPVHRLLSGLSFPLCALRRNHDDTEVQLPYRSHRDENHDLTGRLVGHHEQVNGSTFMF